MGPRRKPISGPKKSNQNQQQSQPSKFGIQHFFDRHTQNSQNPKFKPPIVKKPDSLPIEPVKAVSEHRDDRTETNLDVVDQKPRNLGVECDGKGGFSGVGPRVGEKVEVESESVLKCRGDKVESNLKVVGGNSRNLGVECDGEGGISGVGPRVSEKVEVEGESVLENTPNRKVVTVVRNEEVDEMDVSPEISKVVSAKRFKFSPGMVITVV